MMKIRNAIVILWLCAVLSSCAALGRYKKETKVSPTLYGDAELSDSVSNIANFKWQEVFKDPILQQYITTAIKNNHDYLASIERINQARAQLKGAKLNFIPSLGIPATFSKSFSGTNGFDNDAYNYNVSAQASWQLDIISKVNLLRTAKASLAQMEDLRQGVLSSLIAEVANTYITLMMLDAQSEAAQNMLMNWAVSVETIKVFKECGEADQVAVSQYEANYGNIRIRCRDIEHLKVLAENSLCLLLGQEVHRGLKRGKLEEAGFGVEANIGVPVQLLSLRPDVRYAEREMEIAFNATKGALLAFFPKLVLNGSIGMVNPSTGSLTPVTALANVGAGLTAPVISSGKNISEYRAAQSRQREARLKFEKTLLNAGKEVNNALSDLNTRKDMTSDYASRVESLRKAYEDTEYLMRNSFDKTYLDVLYANTTYFTAKLEQIENISNMLKAQVNLYSTLGGGRIE